MARPTRALIDVAAFRANYRHAKSLAPHSRGLAVVKADAYGHGAASLALALADEADAFAVACMEEAMELRAAGVANPIVLLEGVFAPAELDEVERQGFIPVVHSLQQVHWLLAARPSRQLQVWLKLDSGMHRLGLPATTYSSAYDLLQDCPHVGDIVLMTHFARADETAHPRTDEQLALFRQVTGALQGQTSLANSAATLAWPATHGDWIRPGIMLYGVSPLDCPRPGSAALRPVMHLESALIATHELAAGEPVGYGGRYACARRTRVGVVAMGYADGYPRHAIDGTPVAVKGVRCQVIGRVSMDMLTVDLTPVPDAVVGDPVELWGSVIPANEVARHCDTIAYELFTGVAGRVPRIYSGAG